MEFTTQSGSNLSAKQIEGDFFHLTNGIYKTLWLLPLLMPSTLGTMEEGLISLPVLKHYTDMLADTTMQAE